MGEKAGWHEQVAWCWMVPDANAGHTHDAFFILYPLSSPSHSYQLISILVVASREPFRSHTHFPHSHSSIALGFAVPIRNPFIPFLRYQAFIASFVSTWSVFSHLHPSLSLYLYIAPEKTESQPLDVRMCDPSIGVRHASSSPPACLPGHARRSEVQR